MLSFMFGIPLYSKNCVTLGPYSDLCFILVPFICLAIDIWYSYLKRRGPIRLIYAILCKLCVLLLVFLIGLYGEDTLYSYCIMYLGLVLSSHLYSIVIRIVCTLLI